MNKIISIFHILVFVISEIYFITVLFKAKKQRIVSLMLIAFFVLSSLYIGISIPFNEDVIYCLILNIMSIFCLLIWSDIILVKPIRYRAVSLLFWVVLFSSAISETSKLLWNF